jgi:hypothetical protein
MIDFILMMMGLFATTGPVDGPRTPPTGPGKPDPTVPSP